MSGFTGVAMNTSLLPSRETFTEAAGLSTEPVSTEPYISPAYFELERERVFGRCWLMLGRVEEVPRNQDFIVREIEARSASVIVVRGSDGVIRAFHNVCSHRGNRLVTASDGNAALFRCPYHSWSYKTNGQVAGIPGESRFFNLDRDSCSLSPIAIDFWDGWIFVNLQRTPELTLKEYLGSFGEFLGGLPYHSVEDPIVIGAEVKCNWKLMSDAFVEVYHIFSLHAKTIAGTFTSRENPHSDLLGVKLLGSHGHASMYGDPNAMPSPKHKLDHILASTKLASVNESMSEKAEAFRAHPGVNPTRAKGWSMDVNFVFPNFHLDTVAGGFVTHQFWPLSHNLTRYEYRAYVPKPNSMRSLIQQQHFIARAMEAISEDLGNVERSQKALESRAKDVMHLQDNEVLIRHAINQVDKWVSADSALSALEN